MADSRGAGVPSHGVRLCASADLVERGRAQGFDVLHRGQPARAFVLRHGGRVVAYLNRCAHRAAEMDWLEGEFLDASKAVIVCALHGAEYEASSGKCVAGPCGRGRLTALIVEEQAGGVYWYPSCSTLPSSGNLPAAGHESTA